MSLHIGYAVTSDVAGLFLHVGYSVVEQNLIEGHSHVNFQLESVKSKLASLLNDDSAEQVDIPLQLHRQKGFRVHKPPLRNYL